MTQHTDNIINFWYSDRARALWFSVDEQFDADIRRQFTAVYEAVRRGQHKEWAFSPRGILALVIVLDQFPRNMYRGDALAFGSDALALELTELAIAKGFDVLLSPEERHFLYLPLMHSESLAAQDQSVALFKQLGSLENLGYAVRHHDIIAQFGRFPHRNAVLGRQSTAEELEFLKTNPDF